MAENFRVAANRHFDSADLLYKEGRRVEASQLYAYACECALKAILEKQNALIRPSHLIHINDHLVHPTKRHKLDLVSTYQSVQQGRAAYLLASAAVFNGWTVSERYADGATIRPHLVAHKSDAEDVRRVFRSAFSPGALP